jgi:hypothetical protein
VFEYGEEECDLVQSPVTGLHHGMTHVLWDHYNKTETCTFNCLPSPQRDAPNSGGPSGKPSSIVAGCSGARGKFTGSSKNAARVLSTSKHVRLILSRPKCRLPLRAARSSRVPLSGFRRNSSFRAIQLLLRIRFCTCFG